MEDSKKKKKRQGKKPSIKKLTSSITNIGFQIIDEQKEIQDARFPDDPKKKVTKTIARRGLMTFDLQRYIDGNPEGGELRFKLGLVSCWMDPITRYCVKAHAVISTNSAHQNALLHLIKRQGEVPISSHSSGMSSFSLVYEKNIVHMMRYGTMPNEIIHCGSASINDYRAYYIYDSKALAIKDIVDKLKLRKTIGGLQSVNFSTIPDEFLLSIGYEPIQDLLRNGVTMWKGDPSSVIEAGESTYDYGSEHTSRETRNAESFLQALQQIIQNKAA